MRKIRPDLPSARVRFKRLGFSAIPHPEQLVLTGFRFWYAGYETGDISCWEFAWNELAKSLGPARAKLIVSELASWVRVQRTCACRKLAIYPHPCRYVGDDEACALSLLGACAMQACPLARALAFELIGSSEVEPVIDASTDLARALSVAELRLTWQCANRRSAVPGDVFRH